MLLKKGKEKEEEKKEDVVKETGSRKSRLAHRQVRSTCTSMPSETEGKRIPHNSGGQSRSSWR